MAPMGRSTWISAAIEERPRGMAGPADEEVSWRARLVPRLAAVADRLALHWRDIRTAVMHPAAGAEQAEIIAETARQKATVVWLLGKVQSGKTSIVRALTGHSDAEIGNGYAPCTRASRVFDFPAEAPVIRFLDTRGLGETRYDPSEDIAFGERQAHLVLAVMKALDPQQGAVVDVVRRVRSRRPSWPVVVAQTALHEGYPPGGAHPWPYPFAAETIATLGPPTVPEDLARTLAYQRHLFAQLPGNGLLTFVPIDFTLPEDGYQPVHYGFDPFIAALEAAAPAGLAAALEERLGAAGDVQGARADAHVLGYATAAAAVDAVPLAGLVAVPGVQAKMLHSLAAIHGVAWDRRTLGEFASCIGTGTLIRLLSNLGIRQLVKLVPVYGQTAGALAASAASFATTFALGKAACYFLARRRRGESDARGVAEAYRSALAEAFRLAPRSAAEQAPK
jgi:uncharacterized protein (DUF697 family)